MYKYNVLINSFKFSSLKFEVLHNKFLIVSIQKKNMSSIHDKTVAIDAALNIYQYHCMVRQNYNTSIALWDKLIV